MPYAPTWTGQPSVSDFKTFFARDFNFAPTDDASNLDYVLDADISRAMDEANVNFNDGVFGDSAPILFLWLSAFYLVYNIQVSTQGLGSRSDFPISSKSVGSVSVSFSVPEKYLKDPQISLFVQNGYGLKYLSLAWPYTIGNIGIAEGTTTVE